MIALFFTLGDEWGKTENTNIQKHTFYTKHENLCIYAALRTGGAVVAAGLALHFLEFSGIYLGVAGSAPEALAVIVHVAHVHVSRLKLM